MCQSFSNFKYLIPLWLFPLTLLALEQPGGVISDQNGQPVPYVFIFNQTKDNWTVGDEFGVFSLPANYQAGDSVRFTRIGYGIRTIVLDNSHQPLQIVLPFAPVGLDSVTVAGQTSSSGRAGLSLRQVKRTEDLGAVEHRRLWSIIPGLYLKSYGGPTGISTLSIDGSPSTHTKVIIAGFDLTSAQNGQIDISQLPPAFIASINYSPDQAGNSSAENSEGLLKVEPSTASTGFTFSAGSYGKLNLNANLDVRKTSWSSNLLFGRNQYRGNYEVIWRDASFKRVNNELQQDYFSWQTGYVFKSRAFARLMAFYSAQRRGVAGLVWNPTSDAYRNDALGFIGLKIGWAGNNNHSCVQTLHRHSHERYVNPTIAIDSRHVVKTDQVIYNTHRQLLELYLNLDITSDLKSDRLESKQAGDHSRTTWTNVLATPLTFLHTCELRPWLKLEASPNIYRKATYGSQLSYRGHGLLSLISASYGLYYAYPTFNDLYWKPGGNPNLKPDETTKYEFDISLNIGQSATLIINGYYKSDRNLILWTPVQSYWQPSNIARADRRGAKVIFNWSLPRWPVDGFFQGVRSRSRNLTAGDNYKKALRYTPEESYAAGLNITLRHWTFHGTVEYGGERIAMYSWPEDVTLSGYLVLNANLAYKFNTRIGRFSIIGGCDNVTDEHFESMQGYPEPGRAFTGTIQYNIK